MKMSIKGFVIFLAVLVCAPAKGDRSGSALETQDIEHMVLVRTFIAPPSSACFLLEDNSVHLAGAGDYIGLYGGKIIEIREMNILVKQLVAVNRMEWAESTIVWPVPQTDFSDAARRCEKAFLKPRD
jgi:Tfp pilus assembly protein PilP